MHTQTSGRSLFSLASHRFSLMPAELINARKHVQTRPESWLQDFFFFKIKERGGKKLYTFLSHALCGENPPGLKNSTKNCVAWVVYSGDLSWQRKKLNSCSFLRFWLRFAFIMTAFIVILEVDCALCLWENDNTYLHRDP